MKSVNNEWVPQQYRRAVDPDALMKIVKDRVSEPPAHSDYRKLWEGNSNLIETILKRNEKGHYDHTEVRREL